ncbi:hypothetical protein Aph01nite_43190 [Acrocarpospora phusangensis]|uniref:HTH cro/C1-type domain-containing protein n=1 Tax=Acrocarpospora phusangensis TaxID=1070424 RepID=A0A919QBA7_9ACTN|nr:hypothetical protein Aph01nite_43190 [Acrocarpospora phusangensis]
MTIALVVAKLLDRTTHLDIPTSAVASAAGTSPSAVRKWRTAAAAPSYLHVCAWADLVRLRVAVVDGADVASEGLAVLTDLAALRRRRGLSQRDLAAKRRVPQSAIALLERRPVVARGVGVLTLDRHVSAMGYRLTLLWESADTANPADRRVA